MKLLRTLLVFLYPITFVLAIPIPPRSLERMRLEHEHVNLRYTIDCQNRIMHHQAQLLHKLQQNPHYDLSSSLWPHQFYDHRTKEFYPVNVVHFRDGPYLHDHRTNTYHPIPPTAHTVTYFYDPNSQMTHPVIHPATGPHVLDSHTNNYCPVAPALYPPAGHYALNASGYYHPVTPVVTPHAVPHHQRPTFTPAGPVIPPGAYVPQVVTPHAGPGHQRLTSAPAGPVTPLGASVSQVVTPHAGPQPQRPTWAGVVRHGARPGGTNGARVVRQRQRNSGVRIEEIPPNAPTVSAQSR